MIFRITLFFLLSYVSQAWAHAGGFVERCDKIPLPSCNNEWNAVTSTDSALYLVGKSGYCFIYYHTGGLKVVNTGISDTLTGVQFVSTSVGYIWGKNGKMLKTTNGGINWIQINTGVSGSISKALFIDENNAFFICGSSIYKTTNGGANWSSITVPGGATFKDFHFFDAQNGQICGNITSPSNTGFLYQTTDGGDNWSLLYSDTIAFSKLTYTNGQGYLYGTSSNDPLLLSSSNTGTNWDILYKSAGWQLKSDVVLYKNQPVFITNESGGDYLYNCPYFLDPNYGLLYYPKNIYSTTINGVEMLYIIESSGLYRYLSSELICMQFNFGQDINPNPENRYNTFATNKKVRFKALISNTSPDNITSIRGTVRCRSPYITITDSIAMYENIEGNLTYNNNVWSADEYEIIISDNVPANYIVHFEFAYDNSTPVGHFSKSTFSMPVIFSPLALNSINVVDTATENTYGNDNGIIEPLETAQVKTFIKNTSPHYLYDISAKLNCEFSDIFIWNNYARPDGGGVVYQEYSLGSFNPNQTTVPVGDYVFTDSFEVNYDIPFILSLRGSVSEYFDPSGCSFSIFYNILYNWEIDFTINNSFGLPPDSLRSVYIPPASPITPAPPIEMAVASNEAKEAWNIYPNPCDGKFTLSNNSSIDSFSLINMLGQPIKFTVQKQNNNRIDVDISSHPPGIYFFTLNHKTIKIIKR